MTINNPNTTIHGFLWYPENINQHIQNVHNFLLESSSHVKKTQDIKALEYYLNNVIYPKTDSRSTIQQQIAEKIQQNAQSLIDVALYIPDNLPENIDLKPVAQEVVRKTKIQYQTINKILQKAQNLAKQLKKIDINNVNTQWFQNFETKINEVEKDLENIDLNDLAQTYAMQQHKDSQNLFKRITDLINLLNEIKTTGTWSQHIYGASFEKILSALSAEEVNRIKKNGINELFAEYLPKNLLGQTPYSRDKGQMADWKFESENFSIAKICQATSSKTDVILKIPNKTEMEYYISAKNWSNMYGSHNFGETNLLAALIRSLKFQQQVEATFFGLGALRAQTTEMHQQINEIYQLSLAIDILRGNFVEARANADTLVINDRSKSCIRVFSISDLIKNYKTKLIFENYNFQTLNVAAIIEFNTKFRDDKPSTSEYLMFMYDMLAKTKVTLKPNMANNAFIT